MAFHPTALEPSVTETPPSTAVLAEATVHLMFLDLMMDPLPGLVVKVTLRGKETTLTTDSAGCVPGITAPCGTKIAIAVARFDGGFKEIENTVMPGADSTWNYISPQLVLEAETQLHTGMPDEIEKHIPKPLPANEAIQPKVSDTSSSTPKEPSRDIKAPKPASKTDLEQPSITRDKLAPPGTTNEKSGRTKNGNPMTVLTQKATDWWGAWRLPTWRIWGDAGMTAKQNPALPAGNSKTPHNIQDLDKKPTLKEFNLNKSKFNQEHLAKVKALISFATEQTEYKYDESEGTAAAIAQMARGTYKHSSDEKKQGVALGRCYQYVRIALTRANIVDGYLADKASAEVQRAASAAGPELIKKGFRDVTAEVPDPRWAATGDVIVYSWSEKTWEQRKKKFGKNCPNYGHIDIRSETSYISDFIPRSNHPTWTTTSGSPPKQYSNYTQVRIFRKYYDPTPTCRMKAFLACIREFECQEHRNDSDRYAALNTALPGTAKSYRKFDSWRDHPWASVPPDLRPKSTAAGAYQITLTTWRDVISRGLLEDQGEVIAFSPKVQDRIAIIRIEDRGALDLVRSGDIASAIENLRSEWTSLPGAKENIMRKTAAGKPMDLAYFKSFFDQCFQAELKKAGAI